MQVNFDRFVELKQRPGLRVFVFLLGNEYPYMDSDSNWIRFLKEEVYVVRLTEEEFQILDIGVHPKIFFFLDGKEVFEHNGIPNFQTMKDLLRKYAP